MNARNSRLVFISIGCAAVALAMILAARSGWAIACEEFDPQCMSNGVCQADGSCRGDAINEGLACNNYDPCSAAAKCQSGSCVPTSTKADGTPCAYDGMGLCMKNAVCQTIPLIGRTICYPPVDENFELIDPTDVVICEDLGQNCMECNPQTGQCTIPKTAGPCETGECNPATGLFQDAPNGTPCDANVCTSNEQCQSGECRTGTAPTPTPTFPIPPVSSCTGDCGDSGVVTIDNILTMIDIGLGKKPIVECLAGDKSQDFKITVDEILTAIPNALNGCPALPTPTPTSPPQAATPTVTVTAPPQTSPGPGSAVSGQTTVALGAVSVIGDVVGALANALTLGGGTASSASSAELLMTPSDPGLGGAAGACPLGGSVTNSQGLLTYTLTFTPTPPYCAVPTSDGKVAFQGDAFLSLLGTSTINITATFSDLSGTTLYEIAVANVTGKVNSFSQGGSCFLTAISLKLDETLSTTMMQPTPATVSVNFNSTTVNLTNITFSPACVPTAYDLTLNGPASLLAPDGSQVDVNFNNLIVHVTSSGGTTTLQIISGGMTSPCFGGAATLTSTTLTVPNHQACPVSGVITAVVSSVTSTITFGAGGSVHVQSPTENVNAEYCLDPQLLSCAA
ncbi:MAG: hypothetical protein U0587_15010 [Candidatus Binatia bacterium]